MFDSIGLPELMIILVIILLLFGVGRVGDVGKELGSAIREFRKGLKEDDDKGLADAKPPEGNQEKVNKI